MYVILYMVVHAVVMQLSCETFPLYCYHMIDYSVQCAIGTINPEMIVLGYVPLLPLQDLP